MKHDFSKFKGIRYMHVPKTAGTYMSEMLASLNKEEFRYQYNGHYSKETGEGLLTFAIIRNPFSHLVSIYNHFTDGFSDVNRIKDLKSFEDFIKWFCNSKNNHSEDLPLWPFGSNKKILLFDHIFCNKGHCAASVLIKMEKLNEGMEALMSGFGLKWKDDPLADRNHGPAEGRGKLNGSVDYKNYYNQELKELVEEKCKYELKMFEYNFDGMIGDRFIYTIYDKNPIDAWPLGKETQEKRELKEKQRYI